MTINNNALSIIAMTGFLVLVSVSADVLIVDNNMYRLTQEEQISIAAQLSKDYGDVPLSSAQSWLTPTHSAWRDLDMELIIQKIDRTKTILGRQRFKELVQPLSDKKELEQRRSVFQKLIDDKIFLPLTTYLNHYKEHEWLLLSIFDERSSFTKHLGLLSLFDKGYRTNTTFLAGSMTRIAQLAEPPGICAMMAVYARSLGRQIKDVYKNPVIMSKDEAFQKAFPVAVSLAGFAQTFYVLYKMYQRFEVVNAAIRTLHGILVQVSRAVTMLSTIENLMPQDCLSFHARIKEWRECLTPTSSSYNADLVVLVELLGHEVFQKVPSANIGTSLNTLWQTYEYVLTLKPSLAFLMNIYGIADAYLSVAHLYKEYHQKGMPLSWSTFAESDTPFHDFENLYNPLVAQENIVCNSFLLGGHGPSRHMMITGPHGCGKTTSMKSIAYAYILGQSILLVWGDKAYFVPLTKIGTYLNITDNLAAGISSFMAEKQRIKELRAMAKDLVPHDYCLMLVDEPYAKTLQIVGEERVFNFVQELYHIPQLMMLVATHFEKPSLLEEESHGMVENYQPELRELTPGMFERTFKILKGKATWWFNDARRRSDFIDWLGEVKAMSLSISD